MINGSYQERVAVADRRANQAQKDKLKADKICAETEALYKTARHRESALLKENSLLKEELESKATRRTTNANHESQLQSNKTMISSLQAKAETSRIKISDLECEKSKTAPVLESLRERIARLESESKKSEQAQKTSDGKVSALTDSAQKKDERIESLQKDVENKDDIISSLRREKAESEQARRAADDRAAALDVRVIERDEKIQRKDKEIEEISARVSNLEAEGQRKDNNIQDLSRQASTLTAESQCKDRDIQELSAQVSDLKTEGQRKDNDIQRLSAQVPGLEAKNSESESENERLSKDLNTYKATNEKLDDELAEYKNYVESSEKEEKRKDKAIKDLEAQVSELKAKVSKEKGKAKATKNVKSPSSRLADPAHPTGNHEVHARGSAIDADFDIRAPAKDGNAASKPLVPTAVPSTPAKIDKYKVNPAETPKVVASHKVPAVETPINGGAKADNVSGKKNSFEDAEMTDAFGASPPEGLKGDGRMEIDHQSPTAAGNAGRFTHGAGQPPVTETPKPGFSMSSGSRGATINHGAAGVSHGYSPFTASSGFNFNFGHSSASIPNGFSPFTASSGSNFNFGHSTASIPSGYSPVTASSGSNYSLVHGTASFPNGYSPSTASRGSNFNLGHGTASVPNGYSPVTASSGSNYSLVHGTASFPNGYSPSTASRGSNFNLGHGTASVPNGYSPVTASNGSNLDFGHGTTSVPNGAPGLSKFSGLKPDLDRGITKPPLNPSPKPSTSIFKMPPVDPNMVSCPIGLTKDSIFNKNTFAFDDPSQTSFASPIPTTVTKRKASPFEPSSGPVGCDPAKTPEKPRVRNGVQRVEGSTCNFGDPEDEPPRPSPTKTNVRPGSTSMPPTSNDDIPVTEIMPMSGEALKKEATDWFTKQGFTIKDTDDPIQWGKYETEMAQAGFNWEKKHAMFRYA